MTVRLVHINSDQEETDIEKEMSDRDCCRWISTRLQTGFAVAVKFVPTGGSRVSGGCGGSVERLFLNLSCHVESAIVIHRCSDEMGWHLMEGVEVGRR